LLFFSTVGKAKKVVDLEMIKTALEERKTGFAEFSIDDDEEKAESLFMFE
jgi:hypothetical protein